MKELEGIIQKLEYATDMDDWSEDGFIKCAMFNNKEAKIILAEIHKRDNIIKYLMSNIPDSDDDIKICEHFGWGDPLVVINKRKDEKLLTSINPNDNPKSS